MDCGELYAIRINRIVTAVPYVPESIVWDFRRMLWTDENEKGTQTDDKHERIIEQIKHRGALDATMDQEHLYLYVYTSLTEMA